MFTNHCQACEKRQLIFPSQVTSAAGHPDGIELHYTCWCGAEQSYVMPPLRGEESAEVAQPAKAVAA